MKTNQRKIMHLLCILAIIITLAALAVGIVALLRNEVMIAIGMLLVAMWQIYNFMQWRKLP